MKVLFPVDEAYPLYKIGGLGDVGGSLPKALAKLGIEVAVVLPHHPEIDTQGFQTALTYQIHYAGQVLTINLLKGKLGQSDVVVYLVSEPQFLSQHTDASDNHADKFAVFSLAVAHFLAHHQSEFNADIVHIHDWHTALIPLIVKKFYGKQTYRYMLTIHNLAYQGRTDTPVLDKIGFDQEVIAQAYGQAPNHQLNLLLEGIIEADVVVPVSPTYAREILTPEYGEGLEGHLLPLENKIKGILNGLDLDLFNPQTDKHLFQTYNSQTVIEVKKQNKIKLLEQVQLPVNPADFLIGFVGRVDPQQKGVQLIIQALQEGWFDQPELNFVFLGTGDPNLEKQLIEAAQHKANVRIFTRYDEELAIRIYSGADIMLIPSKFEPCGLVQMIAMRYGSIPVARKTGGLTDTIVDNRDGFLFKDYSMEAMVEALERARQIYKNQAQWQQMIWAGMNKDFSWDASAIIYQDSYASMLHGHAQDNIINA